MGRISKVENPEAKINVRMREVIGENFKSNVYDVKMLKGNSDERFSF